MRAKWVAMILMTGLVCLFFAPMLTMAAGEKDEVNKFYKSAVAIMKKPAHMKELVELVEKNPAMANRCVDLCGRKSDAREDRVEALRMVRGELQDAMMIMSKPSRCDSSYAQKVLNMATRKLEEDDAIFCLAKLVSYCPMSGDGYIALGDLYLQQRRCGMAIAAYQKAVELTNDEDSRKLLDEAKKCKEDYVKQPPLQLAQVKELVFKDGQMAPRKDLGRKATIGQAIQRQILFDEWSFQIKPQYLPELKVMGEGWKEELGQHPGVQIVIEGHTDRRGPYERNMQLSQNRAEAIKTYLVQHYDINSSQLDAQGKGPTRPYSPEDNEAGWALNRRVEFKKKLTN